VFVSTDCDLTCHAITHGNTHTDAHTICITSVRGDDVRGFKVASELERLRASFGARSAEIARHTVAAGSVLLGLGDELRRVTVQNTSLVRVCKQVRVRRLCDHE